MSVPSITVVIPAYNEEKYLPACLEALKKQSTSDFHILVVDNNSTDQTPQIAKKFGASVLHEGKKGYVFALNAGMLHAATDVIAVTDADTHVTKTWVETVVKTFENPDVIAITGSIQTHSGNKLSDFFSNLFYELFLRFNFFIGKPHLVGFNFAVRKNQFVKVGGLDTNFHMSPDVDLGLRLKPHGKLYFVKDMAVVPSVRRWKSGIFKTLKEYTQGYWYAVWLRRPLAFNQTAIR